MEKRTFTLADIRVLYNLTRAEMAEKLSISESHYRNVENGHRNINMKLALKIREVFGISLDSIEVPGKEGKVDED